MVCGGGTLSLVRLELRLAPVLLMVVSAGACGGSSDRADESPVVLVPNEIIEHLVDRVACATDVDVRLGAASAETPVEPTVEIRLENPELSRVGGDYADVFMLSVVDVVTPIDFGGGADSWVWLGPSRVIALSQAIGGALVANDIVEPAVVDRCLARFDEEMDQLVGDIFELSDAVSDEERILDVTEPGTIYFADRFGFALDVSRPAVEAGRILSSENLDGYESYEAMMLANTERAIVELRRR